MKKLRLLVVCLLCMALLAACGGGDVSEVGRRIGDSERYSKAEVARAMDEVEDYFKKAFDGCKLLRLEYDEEKTSEEAREWAEQYEAEEAIVLVSDFYVSPNGGDGSLNQDETYRNWKWILVRTAFGWELKTWGYG